MEKKTIGYESVVRDLIYGGKYSADLVKLIVDDVEVNSWYWDYGINLDYGDIYNEIIDACDEYDVVIIKASRDGQGDLLTESLTLDFYNEAYSLYDNFTKQTMSL